MDDTKKFVKPAPLAGDVPGRIPHPITGLPIAADGEWVPHTKFVDRRLHDGSLLEVSPPAETAAPAQELPAELPAAFPDESSAPPTAKAKRT